jgi:hypothetical protein
MTFVDPYQDSYPPELWGGESFAATASSRFDPGDHTVAEVEQYLADHPDQADTVLAAEAAGKDRATLRRHADEPDDES